MGHCCTECQDHGKPAPEFFNKKEGGGAGENLSPQNKKRGMFHQHCHINMLKLHRDTPGGEHLRPLQGHPCAGGEVDMAAKSPTTDPREKKPFFSRPNFSTV